MTIDEAIDLMRSLPGCLQTMWAVADIWEENEAFVRCDDCDGLGFIDADGAACQCNVCLGSRLVSNGNSARAEALRLLAECGKVGGWVNENTRYWFARAVVGEECTIPSLWFTKANLYDPEHAGTAMNRVALMNAYAGATINLRRMWAVETRALTARTATPAG